MKGMCLFLLSVFSFPFTVSFAQERIMVIADPHVYPKSEIQQQANFDTYMKTQRKMLDLSEPIWCALMDTVRKYRPSLVLIPGDLTKDGETASHAMVSESLKELDLDGIRTLVIPGNHDLPGVTWETLYPGTYRNAAKDPNSHSYAVEPLDGVTVLGIDGSNGSASIGTLSDATLTWLWQQADAAAAEREREANDFSDITGGESEEGESPRGEAAPSTPDVSDLTCSAHGPFSRERHLYLP